MTDPASSNPTSLDLSTAAAASPARAHSAVPIRAALLIGMGVLIVWLFGAVLFQDRTFAYRDAAHFYFPVFKHVQAEWGAGRVPLWNPYENAGVPLAGDSSSSVFYPGKLLFALPLPYATAYHLYMIMHLILATGAMYAAARQFGLRPAAAALAALGYTFSGTILFQYCNVIFLVGAAWLPLAMLGGYRLIESPSLLRLLALALPLAMMVLGGDPQLAYLVALMLGILILSGVPSPEIVESATAPSTAAPTAASPANAPTGSKGSKSQRRKGSSAAASAATAPPAARRDWGDAAEHGVLTEHGEATSFWSRCARDPRVVRFGWLFAACVWAGILSAIQVLPTSEFTARSSRSVSPLPRNIYEFGYAFITGNTPIEVLGKKYAGYEGLIGKPPYIDSRHEQMYEFSAPPWRWFDLLWPNCFGTQFPIHRRWLDGVGFDGGVWVPSNYAGILTLAAALAAIAQFRCNLLLRWLILVAAFGLIAGIGGYGLGWIVEACYIGPQKVGELKPTPDWLPVGRAFGGLYWLMTVFLPSFASFRFPAKLLTLTAFAMAMLAGSEFDRAFGGDPRRLRRVLFSLLIASLGGLVIVLAIGPFWNGWFQATLPDQFFGPFDAAGSYYVVLWSMVQPALAAAVAIWLLKPAHAVRVRAASGDGTATSTGTSNSSSTANIPFDARWQPIALLALLVLDLAIAHGWMFPTVERERLDTVPQLAEVIRKHAAQSPPASPYLKSGEPYRIYRIENWHPAQFYQRSNAARPAEAAQWEHDTLQAKYHFASRLPLARSAGTLDLAVLDPFYTCSVRIDREGVPWEYVQPRRGLDAWNIRYFITPRDPEATSLDTSSEGLRHAWAEPQWSPEKPQGAPAGPPLEPLPLVIDGQPLVIEDLAVFENPSCLPRAWVVHDLVVTPPLGTPYTPAAMGVTQAMLFPSHEWFDLRTKALIEDPSVAAPQQLEAGNGALTFQSEPCHVTDVSPTEVQIECTLLSPGLVVLADSFYPGWQLDVTTGETTESADILQVNRAMRGVILPAGKHRLVYRYVPLTFYLGLGLTAIGVAVSVVGMWRFWKKKA